MKNEGLYIIEGFGHEIQTLPIEVKLWFDEKYPTWIEDLSWRNDATASFHIANVEMNGELRPIIISLSGDYWNECDGVQGRIATIELLEFDESTEVATYSLEKSKLLWQAFEGHNGEFERIPWSNFMIEVGKYVEIGV